MEKAAVRFLVVKKKAVALCALLVLLSAILLFSVIRTGSAAVFLGYSAKQLPVYNVENADMKVAVTFDAAWGDDNTAKLLDALKENGAKATFFVAGFWARKYPELVKRMDAEGMEIGSHSNTHPHMPKLSDTQLDLELSLSKSAVTDITGKEVTLFRAPFGDYSEKTMNACKRADLTAVQWNIDSHDWKELQPKAMAERVLSRVKSGSIILFHNDGKYTAQALPAILIGLMNKGYRAVSVGELLIKGEYYIDHGGTMRRAGM